MISLTLILVVAFAANQESFLQTKLESNTKFDTFKPSLMQLEASDDVRCEQEAGVCSDICYGCSGCITKCMYYDDCLPENEMKRWEHILY